jgi:hypothetical protein
MYTNIYVGRPQGMRPLERPRNRWKDNMKMDVRKIWYEEDCTEFDSE